MREFVEQAQAEPFGRGMTVEIRRDQDRGSEPPRQDRSTDLLRTPPEIGSDS
jgi:hypothetical protein